MGTRCVWGGTGEKVWGQGVCREELVKKYGDKVWSVFRNIHVHTF